MTGHALQERFIAPLVRASPFHAHLSCRVLRMVHPARDSPDSPPVLSGLPSSWYAAPAAGHASPRAFFALGRLDERPEGGTSSASVERREQEVRRLGITGREARPRKNSVLINPRW